MSLLRLPDKVQEYIARLSREQQRLYSGRRLRNIVARANEQAQVDAFEELQNGLR